MRGEDWGNLVVAAVVPAVLGRRAVRGGRGGRSVAGVERGWVCACLFVERLAFGCLLIGCVCVRSVAVRSRRQGGRRGGRRRGSRGVFKVCASRNRQFRRGASCSGGAPTPLHMFSARLARRERAAARV